MIEPIEPGSARDSERFGRERRLRARADFVRVRREGRAVSGACLTLGYARRADTAGAPVQLAPATRVGFTVGKRVGNAVTRNRVRRRLRELIRRRWRIIAPAWDLVVVARPPAAGADAAMLARELDTLLQRAKVLTPGSEEAHI